MNDGVNSSNNDDNDDDNNGSIYSMHRSSDNKSVPLRQRGRNQGGAKPRRKLWWTREDATLQEMFMMGPQSSPPQGKRNGKKNGVDIDDEDATTPHNLRTDEWLVTFGWRTNRSLLPSRTVRLKFARNGYVKSSRSIGRWKQVPTGVCWTEKIHSQRRGTVAVDTEDSDICHEPSGGKTDEDDDDDDDDDTNLDSLLSDAVERTAAVSSTSTNTDTPTSPDNKVVTLRYHADYSMNPFGKHPRMVRGVVTIDRRWLRPVIATFEAIGVGQDTADFSYRERQMGLAPK